MIEVENLCKSFIRTVKDDTDKKKQFKKFKTKKEEFLAVNNVSFKAEKLSLIHI